MFCPKCGHEMIPNGRFCTHCGADVQSMVQTSKGGSSQADHAPKVTSNPEVPVRNAQESAKHSAESKKQGPAGQEEKKSGKSSLAAIIGKNQAYYCAEFERIAAGQKPRFNWAAFLLGPGMCFYRKCENLFKKYFLLSLIFSFAGLAVETVGTGRFDLTLMAIGGGLTALGGLLMLINSIRFGLQFNRLYHQHCTNPQTSKPGVSMKNLVVYYAVVVGLSLLISFAGAAVARQQYADILDPDTSMDEPSDTASPGMQESEPAETPSEKESVAPEVQDGKPTETLAGQENTNTPAPVQTDYGLFSDFSGIWGDGNDRFLFIDYVDGARQNAYACVRTELGEFTAKLELVESGKASGIVYINGASMPSYSISLSSQGDYLDAQITYLKGDFVHITTVFTPNDQYIGGYPTIDWAEYYAIAPQIVMMEEPRDSNGIPYSEYNLYVCEGSYSDYNGSILVTLTVSPNGNEFFCDLFWINGRYLEQGTVRPGVPVMLSGGTTITLDLYQGISAHVLLEGESLGGGPYSIDLMKNS